MKDKNSFRRGVLRHILTWAFVVVLAGISVPYAAAQEGGEIQFNEPEIVTLAPGQNVTRTFTILPGDTVEIKLSRLAEFTYTAVLIDPNQTATPLVPAADGNATMLIENAPLSGVYSLVLQASSGTGDMLIQVNGDSVPPAPLALGETIVDLTTTGIRYELVPPVGMGDTMLSLTALTPTTATYPTLPGYTLVNKTAGETAFRVNAGQLPMMSMIMPAQQTFLLALEPGDLPQQIALYWSEAAATSGFAQPQDQTGQTSQPQGQTGQPASGACQIYFGGQVNIRSGPGTAYEPPIGQAQAGSTLPVTGHDGTYSWYQVTYNGQPGWVSGQIGATELQGNCNALVVTSYPPPPQGQATQPPTQPGVVFTPTYTYTPAPGETLLPTYTYTPTYTPTVEAPPIAPPDNNYALVVPLDGTVSLTDVVSYPDGDVEDVVSYDVSGLNNSVALPGGRADLTFQLQCTGTGTEFIVFRIDGQNYTCGGTFHRTVNIDSRTGAIRITATGGTATYVHWTVVGSAPRLN